ncbi:hypothetical protein SKAU_G00088890 [Synaphobranchus kaupii]|uniref:Uncharacterized protein n=1 Tax=Synaphobranchus kaupii TaxID=118154 RepID=A0A9Q1FWA0_SYNKA|nr:hypothetical protein SKAU_G00088890 [Synaphobranchus kaupii]
MEGSLSGSEKGRGEGRGHVQAVCQSSFPDFTPFGCLSRSDSGVTRPCDSAGLMNPPGLSRSGREREARNVFQATLANDFFRSSFPGFQLRPRGIFSHSAAVPDANRRVGTLPSVPPSSRQSPLGGGGGGEGGLMGNNTPPPAQPEAQWPGDSLRG